MTGYEAVLIFDGDCPFCSAASSALRRLPGVGAVRWADDAAQAFLDAQFDEVPFALALADGAAAEVYVGRAAARELCERAGVPALVGDVVGDNYERISSAARTLSGVERDPDDAHGRAPFTAAAAERYDALAAAAAGLDVHRHVGNRED